MKKFLMVALGFSMGANAGGPVCSPNAGTAFTDYLNKAYTINNDALGTNTLFEQCSNMSDQQAISVLNGCGPLTHPINGLGMNPVDQFLYGLMPTDTMGIGTHVSFDVFPFPSPGEPGDMMKADPVDVYRIGNDGGYERIGSIAPATEDLGPPGLPAGEEQVIPIIHTASSFDVAGNLFVLGYKTNYESSADVMAGTGEVLYKAPKIMIGQVSSANLTAAAGGTIPAIWAEADTSGSCAAVMNQFAVRTNTFSECVVADYIANGNENSAVAACLASTSVLDFGIHDFAVSPLNGNYYAFDTMTIDGTDVLIEVDANTMQTTCTDYPDVGNSTGVLSSLMFSQQNKLVAVFADETTGRWIDVTTGTLTTLTDSIIPFPFGDGSSLPFAIPRGVNRSVAGLVDLIFKNGFEDLIFAHGFDATLPAPTCPAF
ncbi:hypothetical protein [Marinicella litoralis]|uniref:Secreted protein n=1 Tax=Marinicella litoralis TaxID=644220 RepID=A0A4R6XQS5_9GAMM|nr:hypothetical protein [Marinicella litoralis]TDR20580.1 hypothetical protein C8D91_1554 [Marinicella litoralis]